MATQSHTACSVTTLARILHGAKKALYACKDGGRIMKQGAAFGDMAHDTDLRADRVLGERLMDGFRSLPGIARITIEGCTSDLLIRDRGFWVTIDPLDGSLNFLRHGGTIGFPFTCCVTILDRAKDATFNNIVMAGVLDLRDTNGAGDLWIAERTDEGFRTTLNGVPIIPSSDHVLDLGHQIVIGEFYYPEHREKLARLFAGTKGWLRNPGSAAYEMACVASGQAVAFLCDRQKQHELGAGYALVKGAGGVAIDWDGVDLATRPYLFHTQTPAILAANMHIADHLLDLIKTRL